MNTSSEIVSMLGPCRVLDLTDEKVLICGKTLADLGADVIKIEPPGDDSARDIGPFYRDIPCAEESLGLGYSALSQINPRVILTYQKRDGMSFRQYLITPPSRGLILPCGNLLNGHPGR